LLFATLPGKNEVMARIFITGSADGLGQLAAETLISQGHTVTMHARNKKRAADISTRSRGAEAVLVADLSSIEETKGLAAELNKMGRFDAIIHNAGVYQVPSGAVGPEGLPVILTVNTLAPYILTCLVDPPERLIYMSSGLHMQGDPAMPGLEGSRRLGGSQGLGGKKPTASYSDSKLHDLILCKAVARKWPHVRSNAVNPGWVPTRMGGHGATDDLQMGYETQVWLAVSEDEEARVSGQYFFHQRPARYLKEADDVDVQERFLGLCEEITSVKFPYVQ
jgi:NAD(P)-dependent dehydrogenase (short-subunit alcohol dehydrogenase family)